jgi:hypothetical protein
MGDMTGPSASRDRLLAILVLAATAATIIFNFLASSGYVNGVTPEEISRKYTTILTPAGYAFTIWGLIYAGLAAFSIYQLLPANLAKFAPIRSLYLLSCVFNCGWVFFWQNDRIAVCFVMIASLTMTLFFVVLRLRDIEGAAEYWLARAPFGVYFGWVTAALIVSVPITLVYTGTGPDETGWVVPAVVLIAIATALGILVRTKLRDYLYPLAIAWALTAIAVKQSGQTAVVVACAVGVVASLIASLSFVVNLPSRSTTLSASK